MITFDKLKIVADIGAIEVYDKNQFETILKGDEVTSLQFYQEHPYLLMIKVNYVKREVVIEFCGKILGKDYPKLITSRTILQCFETINALGFVKLDIEAMMDADVVKCDVTKDVRVSDVPQFTQYVRNHISNYQQYLSRKLRNGNLVVEKNVVSRKTKKRMTIYDKQKEMDRAENRAFVEANGLDGEFNGLCRFELNLGSKEQIRNALRIDNTKLKTVLSAEANPIADFLGDVIQDQTTSTVSIPDRKAYVTMLILKDCDNDLEKVEAKMREFYRRGTSISAVMAPFRAMLEKMNGTDGADLWAKTRSQLLT